MCTRPSALHTTADRPLSLQAIGLLSFACRIAIDVSIAAVPAFFGGGGTAGVISSNESTSQETSMTAEKLLKRLRALEPGQPGVLVTRAELMEIEVPGFPLPLHSSRRMASKAIVRVRRLATWYLNDREAVLP
jgi:hypothetical protein